MYKQQNNSNKTKALNFFFNLNLFIFLYFETENQLYQPKYNNNNVPIPSCAGCGWETVHFLRSNLSGAVAGLCAGDNPGMFCFSWAGVTELGCFLLLTPPEGRLGRRSGSHSQNPN